MYAEQYRFFEAYLPKFLEELANQLPEGVAKDAVLDNLKDEVSPPSHLELFDKFAKKYLAQDVEISPAMSELLNAYRTVLANGNKVAMAGLLAYECQGAKIAGSKADGLVKHYGADAEAVEFWNAHSGIEEEHAAWSMNGLDSLSPTEAEITQGVSTVGKAWWNFLTERDTLVGVGAGVMCA